MASELEPSWKDSQPHPSLTKSTGQTVANVNLNYDEDIQLNSMQLNQNDLIGTVSISEPVYVVKNKDVEELHYNSKNMRPNKIYKVTWNGKRYGVRKTDTEVEILEFTTDGV